MIFTGCLFDSGSRLGQQFWSTSVAWHGSTVPSDALRADVNSHQAASSIRSLWPVDCSTHQNKLWRPQLCCPRTSSEKQSSWRRSETDLRHSCSVCNCYPAHLQLFPILCYITVLNNNNNNNNNVKF